MYYGHVLWSCIMVMFFDHVLELILELVLGLVLELVLWLVTSLDCLSCPP